LVIRTNDSGPVIRRQPRNLAAPAGSSNRLDVLATSGLPLRYQWQRSSIDIPGQTNSLLAFPNLQDADDGLYRVRVITDAGEVLSRTVQVVAVHPPVITNQTPELNIYRLQGADDEFLRVGVYSKGTDLVFYEWYHNGELTGSIDSMFGAFPLRFDTTNREGQYYVIVRNLAGSVTSSVWTVTIRFPGDVLGWGDNSYGQLNVSRSEKQFIAIAAGALHTLGLRENGTVLAWGDNLYGQTNVPPGLTNVIAVAAGNAHSLALKEDGTVTAWGWNLYDQTNVPGDATNVVSIAAGSYHNLALRNNGTVFGWGDSSYGALNIPSDLTNVTQLGAGDGLSYALLSNGTVRAWGSGGFGAVTIPTNLSNVVRISAAYTHCLALKSNGTIVGLGTDSGWGETQPPSGLSNVIQTCAGYLFSVALRNDATVVAWGRENYGQTHLPPTPGLVQQVAAGGYHALALTYSPVLNYRVTVSQDLLLIFNTNSAGSVFVKDYYLAHRPMVNGANFLGVGTTACPPGGCRTCEEYPDLLVPNPFGNCGTNECFSSLTNFQTQLGEPFQLWLNNNPTKRPRYIILFLDIPSRSGECTNQRSTSVLLHDAVAGIKPSITHINMGDTNACKAYIDKVEFFGTNYSFGKVMISASSGGYGNDRYYFDDALRVYSNRTFGRNARDGVLQQGVASNLVLYVDGATHISAATNVAGYLTWGDNGGQGGNYANDGSVSFSGASGWYVIQTIESYNGQRVTSQGNFIDWFSYNAFGGTNYENTPAGAVTHVQEPFTIGISDSSGYFGLWAAGKNFAICAWNSRKAVAFQAVGDPLLTR